MVILATKTTGRLRRRELDTQIILAAKVVYQTVTAGQRRNFTKYSLPGVMNGYMPSTS